MQILQIFVEIISATANVHISNRNDYLLHNSLYSQYYSGLELEFVIIKITSEWHNHKKTFFISKYLDSIWNYFISNYFICTRECGLFVISLKRFDLYTRTIFIIKKIQFWLFESIHRIPFLVNYFGNFFIRRIEMLCELCFSSILELPIRNSLFNRREKKKKHENKSFQYFHL